MLDPNITYDRVVIVEKETEYHRLGLRYGSDEQANFALNSRGTDLGTYAKTSAVYLSNVRKVEKRIHGLAVEKIDVSRVPLFNWQASDIVVLIGPDGLFPNVAKSIKAQPVICVNPDPTQNTGVIMVHNPDDVEELVGYVVNHTAKVKEVTLGHVTTNDEQELYAVNDFLVGRLDHRSARYKINYGSDEENQISSGIIVATPMGSTGWIKSAMRNSGGDYLRQSMRDWSKDMLAFFVREAFESVSSKAGISFGEIKRGAPLKIISEMPEGGVIFSDGMFEQYITFTTGTVATFEIASRKVNFVSGN